MRSSVRLVLGLVAGSVGCGHEVLGVNPADRTALHEAVVRLIPAGTPFDSARHVLANRGFACPRLELVPGKPWYQPCMYSLDRFPLRDHTVLVELFSRDTFRLGRPSPTVASADSILVRVIPAS